MTSWVDPHPFIESIHTLRFELIHTLLSRSTPFWEEGCGSTQDIIDGPHCKYSLWTIPESESISRLKDLWSSNNVQATRLGTYQKSTCSNTWDFPWFTDGEDNYLVFWKTVYLVFYVMTYKRKMPTMRVLFTGLSWIELLRRCYWVGATAGGQPISAFAGLSTWSCHSQLYSSC